MTNIWHDFSQQDDLGPIAQVTADLAEAAGSLWERTMIIGAFARDLHLYYRFGIAIMRGTEDVDFAFAVPDWEGFRKLRQTLVDSGKFSAAAKMSHRFVHQLGLQIDIVPFGDIETRDRKLVWPEPDDAVMDVFGVREALSSAHRIFLPGEVSALLVSYPALVVLKLVAWNDRHIRQPGKDAADIDFLLSNYLEAGQQYRLWDEFSSWLDDDFEYENAGARMLGVDAKRLLDNAGQDRLFSILEPQISTEDPGVLPSEMGDEDRSRSLLAAMHRGLSASGN